MANNSEPAEQGQGQTVSYPSSSGRRTFSVAGPWKEFFETRAGVNSEMSDRDPNTGAN
ncbi:MAG TPA: hypothetical protein VIY48_20145 [Candidatus Paceibacterota bacterium]